MAHLMWAPAPIRTRHTGLFTCDVIVWDSETILVAILEQTQHVPMLRQSKYFKIVTTHNVGMCLQFRISVNYSVVPKRVVCTPLAIVSAVPLVHSAVVIDFPCLYMSNPSFKRHRTSKSYGIVSAFAVL